jgi:hypothetical protein
VTVLGLPVHARDHLHMLSATKRSLDYRHSNCFSHSCTRNASIPTLNITGPLYQAYWGSKTDRPLRKRRSASIHLSLKISLPCGIEDWIVLLPPRIFNGLVDNSLYYPYEKQSSTSKISMSIPNAHFLTGPSINKPKATSTSTWDSPSMERKQNGPRNLDRCMNVAAANEICLLRVTARASLHVCESRRIEWSSF